MTESALMYAGIFVVFCVIILIWVAREEAKDEPPFPPV